MADNIVTQSSTPATLPDATRLASVEASFSGDTAVAGVGVLAKSSGSEGARTLTLVEPATEGKQDTGNTSLASIDSKTPALGQALAAASVPVVLTAAQISTLTPLATVAVTQSGSWDEVGINDSGNSITVDDGGSTISIDDGGGVITVDGTVAVTNAGLTALNGAIAGTEVQVDVVGALPAGNNNIGDVDVASIAAGNNVIGQVKLTDGTDVADVLDLANSNPLSVAIVDGSGDQITSFGGGTQYTEDAAAAANPVGTVPMLIRADSPAGVTTTDGDNVAQRGTDFGAAYVTLLDSGGSEVAVGGGTQYTEGDTDASITGTAILWEDGSDTLRAVSASKPLPVGDAGGTLSVDDGGGNISIDDGGNTITVDGTVSVTGVATAANQSTQITAEQAIQTSVELIDDAIKTDDAAFTPATTKVMMAGFEFDDSSPDSVDEGDAGAARMSARREIYVQLRDAAGNERGLNVDASGNIGVTDAGGSLTVDGSVTANAGTNLNTSALALESGGNLAASATSLAVIDDWDESDRAKVNPIVGQAGVAAGAGSVGATTQRVTLASDDPAVASLSVLDDWDNGASDGASVSGDVAHDTADAGEPVKIGGKAVSAEPTAVAANDRVNALFDLVGKLIVLPYANPENFVSGAITSAMTGTTSTSLIAAPAAGLRNYITQITVSNAHATVGTDVVIQDGNGGTTLYTIPAAAVYGGAVITFPTPLRQPTTATAIYCANVTTGASTKVSASGYKGV